MKTMPATLYVAPNPTGGSHCNIYLLPFKMKPGQYVSDLSLEDQTGWRHVGAMRQREKNAEGRLFRMVYLEHEFSACKDDLEFSMGGVLMETSVTTNCFDKRAEQDQGLGF